MPSDWQYFRWRLVSRQNKKDMIWKSLSPLSKAKSLGQNPIASLYTNSYMQAWPSTTPDPCSPPARGPGSNYPTTNRRSYPWILLISNTPIKQMSVREQESTITPHARTGRGEQWSYRGLRQDACMEHYIKQSSTLENNFFIFESKACTSITS